MKGRDLLDVAIRWLRANKALIFGLVVAAIVLVAVFA